MSLCYPHSPIPPPPSIPTYIKITDLFSIQKIEISCILHFKVAFRTRLIMSYGNKIKTEGSETGTGGYGKIRNFRNEEIVTGIKKIESMGGLVNKSCQNLVA